MSRDDADGATMGFRPGEGFVQPTNPKPCKPQDSAEAFTAWLLKSHPHSFINSENMEKFLREFLTRGNGVDKWVDK